MVDQHEYDEHGDPDVAGDDVDGPVLVGSRRGEPRPRRFVGCLALLVGLAVIVGGGYFLANAGLSKIKDAFGGPADYSGPGTGSVMFEVHSGDSAAVIGRNLKAAGVVQTVQAFTDAAANDNRSRGIQVGFYQLKKKMSAKDALEVLVDPGNLVKALVTVPEGLTVAQTVAILAKKTDFSVKQYDRALKHPDAIGLPSYANGDAEGFLFPATYNIPPNATATSVLAMMVHSYQSTADEIGLEDAATAGNISPRDAVTVASIIEREVKRPKDLAGVAEVIYNRLNSKCPETGRLLQLDSTVHFAAGANDSVFTTDQMRAIDSPYNTYKYPGLPPGPIAAPGKAALQAALNPTHHGYCFFVAVNLETGKTLFAKTQAQHQVNVAKLDEYCATSDLC